jgi:hypothetical protein
MDPPRQRQRRACSGLMLALVQWEPSAGSTARMRSWTRHSGLRSASEEAKALPQVRMVLRRFRKEAVLADFAAKAQAPVVVADKAKPAPAVGTAVFQLVHGALPPIWGQSRRRASGAFDRDGGEFCRPISIASGACACQAIWRRVQAGR